ncbi:MAG TPA: IS4 family transposase [Planctomycetota bacterium]|nr:IS4 family transposase [Planctomycetota bacterium]
MRRRTRGRAGPPPWPRDGHRLSHVLNAFWDDALDRGLALPTEAPVTAASFCEARPKIPARLLKRLLHEIGSDENASQRWRGRRVYAIDGSKHNLQRGADLDRHFGTPHDAYRPQALVSVLLYVCARMPVDVEVSHHATSERAHLLEMLPSLGQGDLLLLDRGYSAHEVFQALAQDGIDFLARVPSSHSFAVIDELRRSAGHDRVVELSPPPGSPADWQPLRLRAVRIVSPKAEELFFLTSLFKSEAGLGDIGDLYHLRWEIEEFFKLCKSSYIGQGQFRSKSPGGVEQEIVAVVLFLAITRLCMSSAAQSAGCNYLSLSQKAAVLSLAAHITRLFLPAQLDQVLPHVKSLLAAIARAREKRRKHPAFPRVSYQPTPRWGPRGRRGA